MELRTRVIQMLMAINEGIVFYPKLRKFYSSKLKDNIPNIIDVGSNKGQTIDFFLKINPKSMIVGFEPNVTLFNKLKRKYTSNPQIKIINMGISSKKGKLLFYQNVLDETSTFEPLNYESEYLKKKARILGVAPDKIIATTYEVDVITLSDYLAKSENPVIDVLKIDVEGHELDCLKGLFDGSKYSIRYLQLESHNDDMYLNSHNHDEIHKLLKYNGFNEAARIKHGFGDFHEIIYEKQDV